MSCRLNDSVHRCRRVSGDGIPDADLLAELEPEEEEALAQLDANRSNPKAIECATQAKEYASYRSSEAQRKPRNAQAMGQKRRKKDREYYVQTGCFRGVTTTNWLASYKTSAGWLAGVPEGAICTDTRSGRGSRE